MNAALHDERGKFKKGNPGGPGRKRRADEDAIKAALDAALPTSEVVAKLVECVKRRESWAVQLWLAYRWGKPTERIDLDATSNGQTLNALLGQVRGALTAEDDAAGDLASP